MSASHGPARARRRSGSGFTLIELLVAVSIATVVVLAAYAALTGGVMVYNRAGAASAEVQVVRALVDRVTRELQATYFNPQAPDARFVGEEADSSLGTAGASTATGGTGTASTGTSRAAGSSSLGGSGLDGSAARARMAAASGAAAGAAGTGSGTPSTMGARLTFVTAAGLSPLTEVEYFLQEPDAEAGTPGGLYRRERSLLDRQVGETYVVDADSGEKAVLVAPEVVGFEAAYYDSQVLTSGGLGLQGSLTGEDAWQTSWDAAAKGYLPRAVRVTFGLGSWPSSWSAAAGTEARETMPVKYVSFVVPLPLAEALTSQQTGSAAQAGSSTQGGAGGQGGSGR